MTFVVLTYCVLQGKFGTGYKTDKALSVEILVVEMGSPATKVYYHPCTPHNESKDEKSLHCTFPLSGQNPTRQNPTAPLQKFLEKSLKPSSGVMKLIQVVAVLTTKQPPLGHGAPVQCLSLNFSRVAGFQPIRFSVTYLKF